MFVQKELQEDINIVRSESTMNQDLQSQFIEELSKQLLPFLIFIKDED